MAEIVAALQHSRSDLQLIAICGRNEKLAERLRSMQSVDEMIAKMTDAEKKKEATMHLDMSKAEMKKGDAAECMKHMNEAHKAMGM